MAINLLYIGNKLSKHGFNNSSIETLGKFLKQENYQVFFSSSKKNKLFRLIDMCIAIIRNSQKVDYVIIDTYSTTNFWYAFITSQLCRIFRIPYLPILRGGDLPRRISLNPICSNMIFSNAYFNVAPSNYPFRFFPKKRFY